MKIILFIVLGTAVFIWLSAYDGNLPELFDTSQIEQDAKLKVYEVEHNSARAVKKAAGVSTDPVPVQPDQQAEEEQQESGIVEEGARQGRMASLSVSAVWEEMKKTVSGFFSWMLEAFK